MVDCCVLYCTPISNPPPPTPINIIQLIAAWKWVAGGGFGDDLDHPLAVEFRLLPSEDNVQLWELLHWWKYVASWMILLMIYVAILLIASTGYWISLSIFE